MTPEEFREFREVVLGYETRGELAEQMGVHRGTIEHWEYGRRPIPVYAVQLLKCLLLAKKMVEAK
jgi:DNA-binding transcriptional regulator YiaG